MKNIAVALSGGGFRAAAFSLGTLSYLYQLDGGYGKMLNYVKFIGSTSGGSITNIAYSSGLCENRTFPEIYKDLLEFLDGEKVIAEAFRILNTTSEWDNYPQKSRNLINAFALSYENLYLKDKTFQLYTNHLTGQTLEEVCINSTEITNGLSFRFQSQNHGINNGLVGNGYINFKKDQLAIAGQLRLSDILAASSCFPGGFEPIIFPDDFTSRALTSETLSNAINFKSNPFETTEKPDDVDINPKFKDNPKRFGMMDGGIADNQAIDSVLQANKRRHDENLAQFDLLLITDVTSYFIDGYTLPMEERGLFLNLSLQKAARILLYSGLICPLLIVLSFFICWHPIMYLLFVPTLLAFITYFIGKAKFMAAKASAKKDKSTWLLMVFTYGAFFLSLRLSALIQMLSARLKSVLLMTTDIFMKRIRSLYYRELYGDRFLRNIVVSNAIYDLSQAKQKLPDTDKKTAKQELGYDEFDGMAENQTQENIVVSAAIIDIAEKARIMATTLWFDKYQTKALAKAIIVATGQFTTCYNLLKYLTKKKQRVEKLALAPIAPCDGDPPAETFDDNDAKLKVALTEHWTKFNEDPFWLYNLNELRPDLQAIVKVVANNQTYSVVPENPPIPQQIETQSS